MQKGKEPNVGQMVRALREDKKLSLRKLAELSGLSINAISKIERGDTSPTVASLHQLASALGVHITDLFSQDSHMTTVFVKRGQTTALNNNGITIESLGRGLLHQQLEVFTMLIEPGCGNEAEPVSHFGEEYVYCLNGGLTYFVGEQTFLLEPGDRLLFKASQPHSWHNAGSEAAEILLVLQTDPGQPLPHKLH